MFTLIDMFMVFILTLVFSIFTCLFILGSSRLSREEEIFCEGHSKGYTSGYNAGIDAYAEKLVTNVESFHTEVNGIPADIMTEDYFHEYIWEIAEQVKVV
jgi:hypothetical protein